MALLLVVAIILLEGSVVIGLSSRVITTSSTINVTWINTPLQRGDHIDRSFGGRDILPAIVGIAVGLILVAAGIVYRVGYNRFGREKVIVERDDRVEQG